ncbi:NAD(P)/FAD-dependent oxidoreductase [Aureimonas altamirensis]|uniref:NAD(P)/FAD-dependent oxidoreductase n=1 Tax=Aureimonas altamirensis TaxID=370622 RepID=UPI001E5B5121|nr:NAD(P)/FAD-dependent oxidoreductase [Aureimonas altamirensis]UHD45963.1 NAD(P)/FAD-dependent oxidoreductase [Aureimonas altamirensis]
MRFDAIIVGGSFAGLSAATYLGRARRSVLVLDAGQPRNRFSRHAHGFLGQDGRKPGDILKLARNQLAAYPTVLFRHGTATGAHRAAGGGFCIELNDGQRFDADRIILAHGVSDDLPAHPGIRERWGRSVLHCPYCHGFEVAGRRLGVLHTPRMPASHAALIAEWGPTTLFLDGHGLDPQFAHDLTGRGVTIEPEAVIGLDGEGDTLASVQLASGRRVSLDAMFIGAPTRLSSDLADRLGCAIDDSPLGSVVRTDDRKQTTVAGVYAAGDVARSPHSVAWAVGDGAMAGVAVHQSLVFPALAA